MPRKVNYGLDYDDDYDAYDDYDEEDNYDYGTEGNGKPSQLDNTANKSGVWRCSICTYENDENLLSCDICGVLRESSGNSTTDVVEKGMLFSHVIEILATRLVSSP